MLVCCIIHSSFILLGANVTAGSGWLEQGLYSCLSPTIGTFYPVHFGHACPQWDMNRWGGEPLGTLHCPYHGPSSYLGPWCAYLRQLTQRLLGVESGQYVYMAELHGLDHAPTPVPSPSISWPHCPTPIQVNVLAGYLQHHPDHSFVQFILSGLSEGFHVGYRGAEGSTGLRSCFRNHPSALANRAVVSNYIREELTAGRFVGPFSPRAQRQVHCSPIGLVPKGRGSGRWRMIVDLSYPSGRSVNDGISADLCSLQYASIDNALQFVTTLGQGTLLIKVDLKNAYRVVPTHPADCHLFGISWENHIYIDQALPFGLRSAPKLFTAVADAIGWALAEAGIPFQLHYLDDFLFFVPPRAGCGATAVLALAMDTLSRLGVPVAVHKIEGPAPVITFLGIVVDTVRFELRLPAPKVEYIRDMVRAWRGKRSGMRSDFESLLGHLSHAATVIRQGRVFLRHLFTLLAAARSRHLFAVHLDGTARADLLWWDYFLQSWNGTMFFPASPKASVHVYSDASGSFGCGAVMLHLHWFQVGWPSSWANIDIAVKELAPIVIAAAIWGPLWKGARVCFHSDNTAVVAILQKRSARDPVAHHLLRCFYFYAAFFQFEYGSEHVPGVLNVAADALSRNNLQLFSSLIPQATPSAVPIPLLDLLIFQRPDWGSQAWINLFVATLPTH